MCLSSRRQADAAPAEEKPTGLFGLGIGPF
jgi:hypothetical protein